MKFIYTILFFIDTLILVVSSYFFLQKIDNGHDVWGLAILLAGMLASIAVLIILLLHYMKQPSPGRKQEL